MKKIILIGSLLLLITGCSETSKMNRYNIENSQINTANDVYVNKSIGIQLRFPSSWTNFYGVYSDSDSVHIYFKPYENYNYDLGTGDFFFIKKYTDDSELDYVEKVNDKNIFESNGSNYYIGGPTDISYSETEVNFDKFISMKKDVELIANSVEVLSK